MTNTYERRKDVLANGRLIGLTEPCAETKGMWWQVYAYGDKVIALAMEYPCGIRMAEPTPRHLVEITLAQLPLYCDEPTVARWAIENEADIRTHPTCIAGRS